MDNKIDVIQLAAMNKKLDLNVWRQAEKTVSELKKLGVNMESEYRISSPFESKKKVCCGVSEHNDEQQFYRAQRN